MSKYLYMVNPKIQLKLCGEVIRRPKNLELDKEEVKFALRHGPVYRKFDAQTMERVTLQNLDEMHVEKKGMVVEKVKDEDVKVSEGETPVVDTIKEKTSAIEQVAEELFGEMRDATPEEQQSVSDYIESISEEVPVEEVKDEEAVTEETSTEEVKEEQVTEEVPVEEVKEEEVVTEETSIEEQKQPQNNNYYRKKKRNR